MKKRIMALLMGGILFWGIIPYSSEANAAEYRMECDNRVEYDNSYKAAVGNAEFVIGDLSFEIDDTASLAVGKKAKINLYKDYFEDDIVDYKVEWATMDETIATVSKDGEIKALKEGVTTLIANYEYTYYEYVITEDTVPDTEVEDWADKVKENRAGLDTDPENEVINETETGNVSETEIQEVPQAILCTKTGEIEYDLYITDPKLSVKKIGINIYGLQKNNGVYYCDDYVSLDGISDSSRVLSADSTKLNIVRRNEKLFIYPKKKGDHTLVINVDGKKLTLKVSVASVYFKRSSKSAIDIYKPKWCEGVSMIAMQKGEKVALVPKGFPEGEKVKWTSDNKKIAVVDSKGNVKAKGVGETVITAKCGLFMIKYNVGVSFDKAIKALRYGIRNYGAEYSQSKRMQKGYFDCSSFVWKAYLSAGINIGNARNWAPTAAALAYWCKANKYIVYEGSVKTSKLMPGDLIFWTGADNKRYKGIYHVDMYEGNGLSITVRTQKMFGKYLPPNTMVARPSHRKK